MLLPPLTPDMVEEAINRIVAAVHPLQIIAFGSRARGEGRPDSDLDLLVVLPEGNMSAESRRISRRHLRDILADMLFSKDIMVTSPKHLLEKNVWIPGDIYKNAELEGITLWEKGAANSAAVQKVCN